jgi:hypothetical protein
MQQENVDLWIVQLAAASPETRTMVTPALPTAVAVANMVAEDSPMLCKSRCGGVLSLSVALEDVAQRWGLEKVVGVAIG